MTRLSGFFFDVMIVAGVAAIRINVLSNYWPIIIVLGLVGAFSTYFYTYYTAKTLFPAYAQEQFMVTYGMLTGTVTSITFKGMQYDVIVDFKGFKWLIQTTDSPEVGQRIGIRIVPDGFHIMRKSKYSGLYGDYSSFSEEYDELSDAEYDPEAEEESSESREESANEE